MKILAKAVSVGLVVGTLVAIAGCASGTSCHTDACYRERAEKEDPFKSGEVVAWGKTEKQDKDTEEKHREPASRY